MAFYLGRKFGRILLKHLVKPETIQKYDHYFDKAKVLLFLAYFLPFFPDDELAYLAGASSMKSKIFIPLMMMGHVTGSLSLAYVGSGVKSIKDLLFTVLSLVTLVGGIIFALHCKRHRK